jgi:hypothetical protein
VLAGPGRWGSVNIDLGVKVTYADIYNRALIEIALAQGQEVPEPSFGTHFFQDLVEAHIYPLALFPDDPGAIYRRTFFDSAPNALPDLFPPEDLGGSADGRAEERLAQLAQFVKVIDVPAANAGRHLNIVMDGDQGEALGYLR